MTGCRVELKAMNRFVEFEWFNHFISSIVYNNDSAFFSAWQDVVTLAGHSIDIWLVNITNLFLKVSYPQIPHTYLSILTSWNAQLIVLKGYIFNFVMTFKNSYRFYYIGRQNWP